MTQVVRAFLVNRVGMGPRGGEPPVPKENLDSWGDPGGWGGLVNLVHREVLAPLDSEDHQAIEDTMGHPERPEW